MERKESWKSIPYPRPRGRPAILVRGSHGKNRLGRAADGSEAFYLRAAEIRGAAKGMSTDQLLATYSERLRNSNYPTPECLTPDEVQACVSGGLLSAERIQHAEICEGCRSLLNAVEPAPEVLVELMEDVRLMTAQFSGRTRAVAAGSAEDPAPALTWRAAALFHR